MKQTVIDLRKQGKTYRAIAAELGITRQIVAGILKRAGMTKSNGKNIERDKEIVSLSKQGFGRKAISTKLGLSENMVKNVVERERVTNRYVLDWTDLEDLECIETKCTVAENGCIEWNGYTDKDGYGETKMNKQKWKVHRLVYVHVHGQIPEGMMFCHHCDNKKCCNPDHLYAGTAQDNANDKSERHPRGVSADEIKTAKKLRAKGLTYDRIGEILGRRGGNVWAMVNKK